MGTGIASALTNSSTDAARSHGLENAPKTLLRLFEGRNLGKQILEIAPPPLPRV